MRKGRGKNKSIVSRLLAICISLVLAISGIISVSALEAYSDDAYISSESAADVTEIPVSEESVYEEPESEHPVEDEDELTEDENELVEGEDELINDEDEFFEDEEADAIIANIGVELNEVTVSTIGDFITALYNDNVDVIVLNGAILSHEALAIPTGRELTIRGGQINFANNAFRLRGNSTLTLDGVIVQGNNINAPGIQMWSGSATLNLKGGTEVTGFSDGVYTSLSPEIAIDNTINVHDARIHGNVFAGLDAVPGTTINLHYGAVVSGNGNGIALVGTGTRTLNILDGAVISGNNSGVSISGTGGIINMYDGAAIRDNGGRGVFMSGSGTFNMSGGLITENGYQALINSSGVRVNGGTFNMSGGTISENTGEQGGGVFVGSTGTFNMEGGVITGNDAIMEGGGVFVTGGSATFAMEGGTISENSANHGGGVSVREGGTFEMEGGEITRNISMAMTASPTALSRGGGVFVSDGTNQNPSQFIMEGGEITDNISNEAGGGVAVVGNQNARFTMHDGAVISGNTSRSGGGVFVQMGRFTMEDGEISRNRSHGGGGGVYVTGGTFELKDGSINRNESIYGGGGVFVINGSFTIEEDGIIYRNIAHVGSGGGVHLTGANTEFNIKGGVISTNAASVDGGGGIFANGGAEIVMHNGVIRGNALIATSSSGSFGGGGVRISGNNTIFTMENGLITENTMTRFNNSVGANIGGGGVSIADNATFIMKDGEISKNGSGNANGSLGPQGGGVFVGANSTFEMEGGVIRDHNITDSGAGVAVGGHNATFTMSGDALITNNIAAGAHGAGVHFGQVNSTFTMKDNATISYNNGFSGGGVNVLGSNSTTNFIMEGGYIINNTATVGGGVNVGNNTNFVMYDGEISGNTATGSVAPAPAHSGGGVNVSGRFTMKGGIIRDNRATNSTGGFGGGVFVNSGIFELEDGIISENTATVGGGGVAIWSNGTLEMIGGRIINNEAGHGGGIYTENIANLTINSSAIFTGNTASTAFWMEDSPIGFTFQGLTVPQIEALTSIAWSSLSDSPVSSRPFAHLANNYDINFSGHHRVEFNGNGGNNGNAVINHIVPGDILNSTDIPTPTRAGFNFTGWNTAANGSGDTFDPTGAITRNWEVFAQWTAVIVDPPVTPPITPPEPPVEPPVDPPVTPPEPPVEPPVDPPVTPPEPPIEPPVTPPITPPVTPPGPVDPPGPIEPPITPPGPDEPFITPPGPGEPPTTVSPGGGQLVENGEGWIELDDSGVPLGTWTWDTDEEMWIFDPVVPLAAMPQADMPQTGLANLAALFASLIGLSFVIAAGAFVLIKREKTKTSK